MSDEDVGQSAELDYSDIPDYTPTEDTSGVPDYMGEAEVAEPEAPRVEKLVVDGQEVEVPWEDLKKGYQKALAADKRFQEASERERGWQSEKQAFEEMLKKDAAAALAKYGIDFDQVADERLARIIEEATLEPEQLELKKLRDEKAKWEQEHKQKEEIQKKEQFETLRNQNAKEWGDRLDEAFTSMGVAKTPYRVLHAVNAILADMGDKDIAPKDFDVVRALKKANLAANDDFQATTRGLKGDALLEFLGKDVVKEAQKALAAKVRNPIKRAVNPAAKEKEHVPSDPGASFADLRTRLRGY